MKKILGFLVIASLSGTVACKQGGESDPNLAKRSDDTSGVPSSCELSEKQLRLVSTSVEFKALETVDAKSLPESEQAFLKNKTASAKCSTAEVSTLSGIFPSVAARFSETDESSSTAATMALSGIDSGMPGVVRTEYIRMPSGSRYLAGYNADGLMILLHRLLQRRP